MKILSTRTKVLSAILGAVVIVVIAIVAMTQVTGTQLVGTSQIKLSPYESTITQYEGSVVLTMPSGTNCTWKALPSDSPYVTFANNVITGRVVTVRTSQAGKATILATCKEVSGVGYVTVNPPPTATAFNPSVKMTQAAASAAQTHAAETAHPVTNTPKPPTPTTNPAWTRTPTIPVLNPNAMMTQAAATAKAQGTPKP